MLNRETGNTEDEMYPPIKCVYVEPLELLDNFVKGKKAEKLSELLMELDTHA